MTSTDAGLKTLGGPGCRSILDRTLPSGWMDRAVDDIGTLFDVELPAIAMWHVVPSQVAALPQPVFEVVGGDTLPTFLDGSAWFRDALPTAERHDLPGLNHLLQMQDPAVVAETLAAFLAKHPIGARYDCAGGWARLARLRVGNHRLRRRATWCAEDAHEIGTCRGACSPVSMWPRPSA